MNGFRPARSALFRLLSAAFFVLPAITLQAQSVASLPQPADYVSDFAHVLSPEAIARLDSICSQLDHSAAHAQVAVVTVHDLNGDTADDYANNLEDHWKMGNKGENRYAMVLLAVADHKYRIEVGYGLEGILPDGKVGDIGREMIPDLRASDYDGAMTLAVGEIAQVIAADAHITIQDQAAQDSQPAPAGEPAPHHPGWVGVLQFAIFAIFILLYLLRVFGSFGLFGAWGLGLLTGGIVGRGGRGGFSGGGFGGGGGGGGSGFGGFGGMGGGFGGGGAGGSW